MTGTVNEENRTFGLRNETKEATVQKGGSSCLVQMVQFVMMLLAVPVGYAVSYFFQPDYLRAKFTIVDYFTQIKEVVSSQELAITAFVVTIVVALGVLIATLLLGVISRSR